MQQRITQEAVSYTHLDVYKRQMLVSALYGYEKTMHAYEVAVAEKYRFFSFGDAMLIV